MARYIENYRQRAKTAVRKSRLNEKKEGKEKIERVKSELILEAYCLISKQPWELHWGVNMTLYIDKQYF